MGLKEYIERRAGDQAWKYEELSEANRTITAERRRAQEMLDEARDSLTRELDSDNRVAMTEAIMKLDTAVGELDRSSKHLTNALQAFRTLGQVEPKLQARVAESEAHAEAAARGEAEKS